MLLIMRTQKKKGIPVVNVPTYGTQIVGQYVPRISPFEICSHYGHHDECVKEAKMGEQS